MLHGLISSPYELRTIAKHLNDHCFNVIAPLLPGHGTRPGDMLEVSRNDWRDAVEYAIDELSKDSNEIYIFGISTGGALAVEYTLKNDNIDGLILFVPAIDLPKKTALAPFIKYFKKWVGRYDDKNIIKYESLAMNAAAEVYKLSKEIQRSFRKNAINTKVFAAFTYIDRTIDGVASIKDLLVATDPANRHITIYHPEYVTVEDSIKQKGGVTLINSTVLSKSVLSMSHNAMHNGFNDEYLGINGRYRDCLHYYDDTEEYGKCKTSKSVLVGETTKENLAKGLMVRNSYNIMIDSLLRDLDKFFELE